MGEVGKPHGLNGEVYVMAISDDPARFEPGSVLETGDGVKLTVAVGRRHHDRLLVTFEGVSTREAAERLRGPLYVAAGLVRALEDHEFWLHEVEDMEVVDPRGEHLGTVARVVPGGAQDLLAVTSERGETLVPLVKEIVMDVDRDARRVVVDAPEGLFE